MQIEIKKDIEKAYRDEYIKGLSVSEVATLVTSAAVAIGIVVIAWKYFHVPLEIGPYIAIPLILPILATGFVKIQGLSLWRYLLAALRTYQYPILIYEASELPKHPWPLAAMDTSLRRKGKRR